MNTSQLCAPVTLSSAIKSVASHPCSSHWEDGTGSVFCGGFSRNAGLVDYLRLNIFPAQEPVRGPARSPQFMDRFLISCSVLVIIRLLASHEGETSSIPGRVTPGFSQVGIMPDDAAGRRVLSRISRFPHPYIPALLHTHLISPQSAPKTAMLRAALISSLTDSLFNPSSHCVHDCGHVVQEGTGIQGLGKRETPEKTRQLAASSDMARDPRISQACSVSVARIAPAHANPDVMSRRTCPVDLVQHNERTLHSCMVQYAMRCAREVVPEVRVWVHCSPVSTCGRGRGGRAVRLLASHQGEPGSIAGRVTPGFSQVRIVPDDAAGRQVSSGISRFPPPFHSGAAPYSPHFTLVRSPRYDMFSLPYVPVRARATKCAVNRACKTPHTRTRGRAHAGGVMGAGECLQRKLGCLCRARPAGRDVTGRAGRHVHNWSTRTAHATRVMSVPHTSDRRLSISPHYGAAPGGLIREIPEKTRRPAASSGTIPSCENLVTQPGIEPDFRIWESCRTMLLVGGFPRGYPVSLALPFRRCFILRPISQDLDVKPSKSLHSLLPLLATREVTAGHRRLHLLSANVRHTWHCWQSARKMAPVHEKAQVVWCGTRVHCYGAKGIPSSLQQSIARRQEDKSMAYRVTEHRTLDSVLRRQGGGDQQGENVRRALQRSPRKSVRQASRQLTNNCPLRSSERGRSSMNTRCRSCRLQSQRISYDYTNLRVICLTDSLRICRSRFERKLQDRLDILRVTRRSHVLPVGKTLEALAADCSPCTAPDINIIHVQHVSTIMDTVRLNGSAESIKYLSSRRHVANTTRDIAKDGDSDLASDWPALGREDPLVRTQLYDRPRFNNLSRHPFSSTSSRLSPSSFFYFICLSSPPPLYRSLWSEQLLCFHHHHHRRRRHAVLIADAVPGHRRVSVGRRLTSVQSKAFHHLHLLPLMTSPRFEGGDPPPPPLPPSPTTKPTSVIKVWSSAGMKGRGKREIPEKTRLPTASSGKIPTCENPVTRPGIEPGSPWWEAN
ncbi:hypothetical protein PR048_022563 [Dryococelus australis]|uniref:Uncharacterized protein n=1 Tax=Dryococelus australis TaxID=614101 RepID=A0ABQ9H1E7_9NEOP|nr:hypothetical protein PR048_022563 [Dryococelus australis]